MGSVLNPLIVFILRAQKEAEDRLGKLHKLEMDQLLEEQDKKLDAELAALRVELNQEYDAKIQHVHAEYAQKQEQSNKDHELALLVKPNQIASSLFIHY